MRALPQAARHYLVALWCTALLLPLSVAFIYPVRPLQLFDILSALIFAGMFMVGDLTSFEVEDASTMSITIALLIAGVTALGWPQIASE